MERKKSVDGKAIDSFGIASYRAGWPVARGPTKTRAAIALSAVSYSLTEDLSAKAKSYFRQRVTFRVTSQ